MKIISRRNFISSTSAAALLVLESKSSAAFTEPFKVFGRHPLVTSSGPLADRANYLISHKQADSVEIYTGQYGLVVRNLNDGLPDPSPLIKVAPGTLWHQDIWPPNQIYPANTHILQGPNGKDQKPGAWQTPTLAVLVKPENLYPNVDWLSNTWNTGVFYSHDSNSVDKRAHLKRSDNNDPHYDNYNAPYAWLNYNGTYQDRATINHGAGEYAQGNPNHGGGGGGAGPHVVYDYNDMKTNSGYQNEVDQKGFYDRLYDLYKDKLCQVDYQIQNPLTKKNGFDAIESWLPYIKKLCSNTQHRAWFMDLAVGWMNNPRPMITFQNALWIYRDVWCNPNSQEPPKPNDYPYYWGWNEIPFDKNRINNPANWFSYVIVLPPVADGYDLKLSDVIENENIRKALVEQLDIYKHSFNLQNGSPIVLARQAWNKMSKHNIDSHKTVWYREFFAENVKINEHWSIFNEKIVYI